MKKILLTLGTIAIVATPIAAVVACGSSNNGAETYRGKLAKDKKIKILTLGDSVAHGDYTFQMSGSGTGYVPLLDGPARVASYQDYLFDELQRDGLMDKSDVPNYKTSASGLRSGELAQWLIKGTYLDGMKADNPEVGTQDEKKAAKEHVDYHRHPYTQGAGKETWWDDGLVDSNGKQIDAKHVTISNEQQDQVTMKDHVKESDVVLITIGGNDILKDIMLFGTPFPQLGSIDWTNPKEGKIAKLIGALLTDKTLNSQPGIKSIISSLPTLVAKIKPVIANFGTKLSSLLSGGIKSLSILKELVLQFTPLLSEIETLPISEREVFEQWFLAGGHKMLIDVDKDKLKESLDEFKENIKLTSDKIHEINPEATIIFTGYPSPMMHFPKIFRNLAMPIYGQIAEATQEFADSAKYVNYVPSSLQNWETDDPVDIYDNIPIDPHPTLEGQGFMAKEILKKIDDIYDLNAELTDDELKTKTSEIVESHKLSGPKMTEEERNKAIADGTYKYPYQTLENPANRGDLDYAYGVKPLPLEEIAHAKVYFPSRILGFLVDAITDSIKLNPHVENPDDQSVPYSGDLTLSDFTKQWGDNYLAYAKTNKGRFIEPLSKDFSKEVHDKFSGSLIEFIEKFTYKINDLISTDKTIGKISQLFGEEN